MTCEDFMTLYVFMGGIIGTIMDNFNLLTLGAGGNFRNLNNFSSSGPIGV